MGRDTVNIMNHFSQFPAFVRFFPASLFGRIINIYKTPPPIPKRVDSVAKNIDQYFRQDLVKQAEKEDIVQDIEPGLPNETTIMV